MTNKRNRSAKDPQRGTSSTAALLPDDIPLWFHSFARYILRVCSEPGRYHITLDVPSRNREPRELQISLHQILAHSLLDNRPRKPTEPEPGNVYKLRLPKE